MIRNLQRGLGIKKKEEEEEEEVKATNCLFYFGAPSLQMEHNSNA